jgi:PEP-CTERM motif
LWYKQIKNLIKQPMKTKIAAVLSLLSVVSVRADIANYDATIVSQSPLEQFNFADSLSANAGSGTFAAGASTAYTTDLSGNANGALSVTATEAGGGYTLADNSFIAGQGTVNSVGTLSFLFNISTPTSGTEYFLSVGGDTTADGNALALAISGGQAELKIGGHSANLPALTANAWYYIGITWDFNGTTSDTATYYLGELGGTLSSTTLSGVYAATYEVGGTSGETGSSGDIVIGNRQADNSSMDGDYGTLATWSSQLSSAQITDQFDALTTSAVPEPSTTACIGVGGLLLGLILRKKA